MAVVEQNSSRAGEQPRASASTQSPDALRYRLRDRGKIKRVVSNMEGSEEDGIDDQLKRMPSLAWPGEDDMSTLSYGMRQMTTSLDNDTNYVPGREGGTHHARGKAPTTADGAKSKQKGGTGLQAWRILIRMLNNLYRRHHDKAKWKDVAGKINRFSEDDSRVFLKSLGLTPGDEPLPPWHSLTKDRVYNTLAGGPPRLPATAPCLLTPLPGAPARVRQPRGPASTVGLPLACGLSVLSPRAPARPSRRR